MRGVMSTGSRVFWALASLALGLFLLYAVLGFLARRGGAVGGIATTVENATQPH